MLANPPPVRQGDTVDAEALKTQGEKLMMEQRIEEAVNSFRQATLLNPTDDGAFLRLGIALSVLGRRDPAMDAFASALAVNPHSIPVYYNRSGLKRYQPGDPEIPLLEGLLADPAALPLEQRIMAHFTLGKAWLDINDADRAFPHFHQGNGLYRRTFSYDVDAALAQMAEIARVLTKDTIDALKVGGNLSVRPIFIVGMPRSGSTLVEQILASHPNVAGAGEIAAFRTVVQSLRQGNGHAIPYPLVATMLNPTLTGKLGDLYLQLTQQWVEKDKPRLTDKFLENFLYAGLIHATLPNAKIVHCRRDPIDTCLSCYTTMFGGAQEFTFDMNELGRYWQGYERLTDHWRDTLPSSHFIEASYEDIVADAEGSTRRLLHALDLPWNERCLTFHANDRPVMTASSQQVRQPIHGNSKGRWKRYRDHIVPLLQILGQAD